MFDVRCNFLVSFFTPIIPARQGGVLSRVAVGVGDLYVEAPEAKRVRLLDLDRAHRFATCGGVTVFFTLVYEEDNGVPVARAVSNTVLGRYHEPTGGGVRHALCVAVIVGLAAIFTVDMRDVLVSRGAAIFRVDTVSAGGANRYLPRSTNAVLRDSVLDVRVKDVSVAN